MIRRRDSGRRRGKAVHGRVWKLRGSDTWEAQVIDENGELQKICITVPPGSHCTVVAISHTSGFRQRVGDTDNLIGP